MSAAAVAAAVVLAREFGRTAETDGLFAAYAVYLVLVLAAQASRVVLLPTLARAAHLRAETGVYALALALLCAPLLAFTLAAPDTAAFLLAGGQPAREAAAGALVWLVPAGVAQLYAALAASVLAARDSYGVAAAAYALGAFAGLAVFLLSLAEGPVSLAIGLAANGALTLAVMVLGLLVRGDLAGELGGMRERLARRAWELARGVALPLALQGLYLIGVRFAGELEVGAVTTLGYAYFAAAFLVAVTASSLSLVSSVPLARSSLTRVRAAEHVASACWLSLAPLAGAAGFAALAGGPVAQRLLGDAFAGESGDQLGALVAWLSPWIVASVGVSVSFPLLFVARRERRAPLLAAGALALHGLLAWVGLELGGLEGIVLALAATTGAIFAALLHLLAGETALDTARRLLRLLAAVGCLGAAAFGSAALLLDGVLAGLVGLAVYTALLARWRPRGLRAAWLYMRGLA